MRTFRICMMMLLLGATAATAQTPLTRAAATITQQDVAKRIQFLASDDLRGRDTPSPGLDKAAEYIAAEFKSFGLKPAGDAGTYIQRWPFKVAKVDASSIQAELRGATPRKLTHAKDFFVIPSTTVDSVTADVVW